MEQGRGPRAPTICESGWRTSSARKCAIRIRRVCVNDVRVTRDSRMPTSSYRRSASKTRSKKELVTVLEHAAGFLRSAVARDNTMRTTPKLRFHYDDLIVEGARIETLIRRAVAADEDSQRRRGDGD